MKSSTLSKKLKVVLSEKKLNKPGKNIGFSQRLRQIPPFQLIKPEFAQLMRDVADKVFNHRVNTKLKCNHPVLASFDKLLIRDGSSFAIHKALKKNYPGRFTAISPAAVELHVTYDLKTGGIEKSTLTPDSFSERAELPDVHELENQLLSGDRGYYSGQLISST